MKYIAFKFCLAVFAVLIFAQSALAQARYENYQLTRDKYVVSDSAVIVYPLGNADGYYRVFDFAVQRVFIMAPGKDEVPSYPFDSNMQREVSFVLRTVCSWVEPKSDFKRFC